MHSNLLLKLLFCLYEYNLPFFLFQSSYFKQNLGVWAFSLCFEKLKINKIKTNEVVFSGILFRLRKLNSSELDIQFGESEILRKTQECVPDIKVFGIFELNFLAFL